MGLLSRSSTRLKHIALGVQRRSFTDYTAQPTSKVQVYVSQSLDPYLNLSVEHYLLQKSHPDSLVLFLYRNRPCVVIGRNQNPWLEVNLGALRRGLPGSTSPGDARSGLAIDLVRRRSGGGTVFHDEGNVNYSVVCPSAIFNRDKHAEMVVRALSKLGVANAKVNCRHDIVLEAPGQDGKDCDKQTYKVSGSAYKLTRLRSLHHGTCLLSSPNLGHMSVLLRSPAEPYIKARGVESVRSKVRNVNADLKAFEEGAIEEFQGMYGSVSGQLQSVTEAALEHPDIRKGYDELKSLPWIFGQTPQFTFSTRPTEDDARERPASPSSVASNFRATLTVRHGQIQDASVSGLPYQEDVDQSSQDRAVSEALVGSTIYEITSWDDLLRGSSVVPLASTGIGAWLDTLFGHDTTHTTKT